MAENDKNFNEIKLRILQYIDARKVSIEKFCKENSIVPSNLAVNNLKSDFGGLTLAKILMNNCELSPDWLLNGIGGMLRKSSILEENCLQCSEKDKKISNLLSELNEIKDKIIKLQDMLIEETKKQPEKVVRDVGAAIAVE